MCGNEGFVKIHRPKPGKTTVDVDVHDSGGNLIKTYVDISESKAQSIKDQWLRFFVQKRIAREGRA